MRASDALILGSTMLKPLPRTFDDGHGSGCAMGMMNRAIGGTERNQVVVQKFRWMMAEHSYLYPCGCTEVRKTANDVVIHLFDSHWSDLSLEHWSIERIADWLRSVEPAEVEERVTEEVVAAYA